MQSRRKAQESLRIAFPYMIVPMVLSLLLMNGTMAQALEVAVSYSFPQVGQLMPPPEDMLEGGILVTFKGDTSMEPMPGGVIPEQVDSRTWTTVFPWDWTQPVVFSFRDIRGSIASVVASPEPVIPFGSETHQLMTFRITTEKSGLWDPAVGLYVYGDHANFQQHGAQWERAAQVDFFNPEDQSSFSEPVGLRIHGGWSRRFSQKSFRLYFDDYGSANELSYDFFGNDPTNFQRLLLRTHRFPFNCFNSDILESIWMDRGHLGSRSKPAVAYVNDEFWGVYSLRERLDDEFLEVTHGIQPDSYTYIKDGVVEKGDPTDWANFIASFSLPQEFASHAWFEDTSRKIDLNTYVDWLLMNIYAATADNGFDYNLAQLKVEDGPWRFIMWDEDDTFFPENINADLFQFFSSENQADFEENVPPVYYSNAWDPAQQLWTTMFRGFMQNSEFKALFFTRLEELLDLDLAPQAMINRIDAVVDQQGSEMDLHAQRWAWDGPSEFTEYADQMKDFVIHRPAILRQQAAAFKEEFRQGVELISFETTLETDGVHLDWTTQGERDNSGFMVMREVPGSNSAEVVDGFFQNQDLAGQGDTDELVHYHTIDASPNTGGLNRYFLVWFDLDFQQHVLPWIASQWAAPWDGLVFNEFMADNDHTWADGAGEYDDWLEIFNGSEVTVNLDSLYITDDVADATRHQLRGGLQLAPGEHLILWADDAIQQGFDHLNFKLSAAGEGLFLFAPDGETLITSVEFDQQVTDVALARETDGADHWMYSAVPTPAASNGDPQTQSLLRLNELMGENSGLVFDEMGEYEPWLELFNPLPVPIDLRQLELKLVGTTGGVWDLSSLVAPPGYQLLWLDGQPEQGEFHAPYPISSGPASFELRAYGNSDPIDLLDWQHFPEVGSIARVPDGSGPWQEGVQPTPQMANPHPVLTSALRINEFMALNGSVIADETGVFEDWVEIYNPAAEDISLLGMFLTDDLASPTRWAFPDTTLAAGQYMIVWCDSDPQDGPLHTNFKLSGGGEAIGLYSVVDEVVMAVDDYTFGPQVLDISEGRAIDGRHGWEFFDIPSPGAANNALTDTPLPMIHTTGLLPNFPNPFNPSTTIVFALENPAQVHLAVHDLRGHLVALLVQDWQQAGRHEVVWSGGNLQGSPAASGVYLIRLQAGMVQDSQRILLLK